MSERARGSEHQAEPLKDENLNQTNFQGKNQRESPRIRVKMAKPPQGGLKRLGIPGTKDTKSDGCLFGRGPSNF